MEIEINTELDPVFSKPLVYLHYKSKDSAEKLNTLLHEDDFDMEMGLACVVCRQMTDFSDNQLVECQECHNVYHQDCHKPQVTDKDVNDPCLVWYCARCTRQMKRMAQKNQKPTRSVVSAATLVVKDPSISKPEVKPKADSANTFLAFKRAEVKAIISPPVTSILSKPLPPERVKKGAEKRFADRIKVELNDPVEMPKRPRQEKPEARSSPITEEFSKDLPLPDLSSADESSATAIPVKALPPLILGKRGLSRSMSSDNVSKVGLPSPSTPTGNGANINIQLSNSNAGYVI